MFLINKYFPIDRPDGRKLYSTIGETIKKFYPIGINPHDPGYIEFPGVKLMSDILVENIGDNKIYREKWSSFLTKVRKESKKEVHSTTYGLVPGYSGDIIMERYQDDALIRIKRIAFAVSLLGQFYSVCGVDETFIRDEGKVYHAINVVTASPYKEFEADFNGINLLIKKHFKDYLFVPFEVCMMEVKGVQTPHWPADDAKIYDLLFNHLFNFYTHRWSRGERWYGNERNPNVRVTLGPRPAT